MRIIQLLVLAFFVSIVVSCETTVKKTPDQMKEEAREAIVLARGKLMNATGQIDTNRANSMINMYITFVKNNANDEDASEFMFQAASMCMSKGDYRRAIRLFETVCTNYSDSKRTPEAYFLIAFVRENKMNQLGEAEEAYKLVIEKFPRSDWSLQARAALKNMSTGKTDLELVRMFEEQNAVE